MALGPAAADEARSPARCSNDDRCCPLLRFATPAPLTGMRGGGCRGPALGPENGRRGGGGGGPATVTTLTAVVPPDELPLCGARKRPSTGARRLAITGRTRVSDAGMNRWCGEKRSRLFSFLSRRFSASSMATRAAAVPSCELLAVCLEALSRESAAEASRNQSGSSSVIAASAGFASHHEEGRHYSKALHEY